MSVDTTGPDRTGTVGLVLRRPLRTFGIEAFYNDFIAGVEDSLNGEGRLLVLQVVADMNAELETYRRWKASGRVGAVILVDVLIDQDPRLAMMDELGFDTLVLAHPDDAGQHSVLWTDERALLRPAVEHLRELGHERIGRVTGPPQFSHTVRRTNAFLALTAAAGASGCVLASDYTREGGAASAVQLLRSDAPPTAIIFDNDVMAAGAVEDLTARGVRVPEDLAVLAGDDSVLCRITAPPLTALHRDVKKLGALAGRTIIDGTTERRRTVVQSSAPSLIPRQSTRHDVRMLDEPA